MLQTINFSRQVIFHIPTLIPLVTERDDRKPLLPLYREKWKNMGG
jgi:hypothetical protein